MPFNKSKYPANWAEISKRIRFERAGGQCEAEYPDYVDGQLCMVRCEARHGERHPKTGSKVVLTTAHLADENPMNCDDENLAALCQKHHLGLDRARTTHIITTKRLKQAGFRMISQRNDRQLEIWRIAVADKKEGGLQMFESGDDLCIDVAVLSAKDATWHCWIAQEEPYRHIHIRPMKYMHELADLFKALTGKPAPWQK